MSVNKMCFGHTVEQREDGSDYATCSVVVHDEYEKFVKNGECDNFGCPFYKPITFANFVRIGNKIYPLVDSE